MELRNTIIDILLATSGQSEGVTADAILSAIGSGAEPVEIWLGTGDKLVSDIFDREEGEWVGIGVFNGVRQMEVGEFSAETYGKDISELDPLTLIKTANPDALRVIIAACERSLKRCDPAPTAQDKEHWSAKNPGRADQYKQEAMAARAGLGFASDADDVAPADILREINKMTAQDSKVPEAAKYIGNWPLNDCIERLIEAANILLNEKDYDGHGHEFIATARDCAIAHLAAPSLAEKPQLETAEECFRVMGSALARIKELNAVLQRPQPPEAA